MVKLLNCLIAELLNGQVLIDLSPPDRSRPVPTNYKLQTGSKPQIAANDDPDASSSKRPILLVSGYQRQDDTFLKEAYVPEIG